MRLVLQNPWFDQYKASGVSHPLRGWLPDNTRPEILNSQQKSQQAQAPQKKPCYHWLAASFIVETISVKYMCDLNPSLVQ